MPPEAPVAEPTAIGQPLAPRGPRAWTRGTFITLIVCIALLLGAAIGAATVHNHEATAHERQAAQSLHGFLESSTQGDMAWRDFANHKMLEQVSVGSPLLGDRATAKALKLSVEYEVGALNFRSDLPGLPADLASATLSLTYGYTMRDQKVESTAEQVIWLSRPFYYGDDVPARATGETPSAVGPWRVTSLTLPKTEDGNVGSGDDFFATDFEVPAIEDVDGNICFDAPTLLEDVSTAARTLAEIRSHCFVYDGEIALDENVDMEDLAANFPVISSLQRAYLPAELLQLDPGIANNSVPPLREYLIHGTEGKYVIAIALVEVSGNEDLTASNRIVSIQLVEEEGS